ncbi:MAG: chemotaxis response regulator protein-glutamate methylesterase [Candidatus Omnitrophota bacterium]
MSMQLKNNIRVLVVDDSPLMCKVFTNILNSDPQIMVVGIANNGKDAVDLVSKLKPDIITMDIHMPVMDGLEATKQIMAYTPTPILVVSTSVFKMGMAKVFAAISYGALDVIEKGDMEFNADAQSGKALIEKIKFLSNIRVVRHPLAKFENRYIKRDEDKIGIPQKKILGKDNLVAMIASTGGPQAIIEILRRLPENFPCSIVIVQHISLGFVEGLADWLNNASYIKVRVAEDSEDMQKGVAYIAPSNFQMRVEEGSKIHLSNEPAYNGHRPSGDILFESAARIYGENAIGIILTGMGSDGAMGIKAIKEMGGRTIAQDESSCIIYGMPKVAVEMGAIDKVLPLEKIPEALVDMLLNQPEVQD